MTYKPKNSTVETLRIDGTIFGIVILNTIAPRNIRINNKAINTIKNITHCSAVILLMSALTIATSSNLDLFGTVNFAILFETLESIEDILFVKFCIIWYSRIRLEII